MAIGSSTNRVDYAISGSTGPFAVPFPFFLGSDLRVVKVLADGTEQELVYTTDFTTTGGADATGAVTLVSSVGVTLSIDRGNMAALQPVSIPNQGPFLGKTMEGEFDRLTMLLQQLLGEAAGSLHLPMSEVPSALKTTIANATKRAGGMLAFDVSGNPTIIYPTTLPLTRVVTLAGSGTIATDASLGEVFDVPLSASSTMAAPTHLNDGQTIFYRLQQTGAGSWTVTWNAMFDWGAAGAPALTTTTGKTDVCGGKYCARTGKVMMFPAALGYAA